MRLSRQSSIGWCCPCCLPLNESLALILRLGQRHVHDDGHGHRLQLLLHASMVRLCGKCRCNWSSDEVLGHHCIQSIHFSFQEAEVAHTVRSMNVQFTFNSSLLCFSTRIWYIMFEPPVRSTTRDSSPLQARKSPGVLDLNLRGLVLKGIQPGSLGSDQRNSSWHVVKIPTRNSARARAVMGYD